MIQEASGNFLNIFKNVRYFWSRGNVIKILSTGMVIKILKGFGYFVAFSLATFRKFLGVLRGL